MKLKKLKQLWLITIISCCGLLQAQTVKGKIMSDNLPLPGANILVKGTNNGTISDFDGTYKLDNVSPNATLVFSYVGYVTQEILVEGRSVIDVNLDSSELEEVVVVAYGTSTKKDLTGAVSTVSSEELVSFPTSTVDQALQGKTAGVQIVSNSGAPGTPTTVNIRGTGSFGSTAPLYVIDGFPTQDASFLNPNTIESISVLKDASATALYGVRASNGVIIINTKQGKAGKVKVELNSFIGVRQQPNQIDVLDVDRFAQLATELSSSTNLEVAGEAIPYANWSDPSQLRNINWQDEVFSSSINKSVTLNVRGGGEKIRSSFSLGYYEDEGTLIGSNFKRYDVGFNASYDITDKVRIKSSIKYTTSSTIQTLSSGRDNLLNLYATIPHLAPIGELNLNGVANVTNVPVDSQGNFGAFPDVSNEAFRDGRNWVARALENDQDNIRNALLANVDAEWDVAGGLSTQLKLGGRVNNIANSLFQPSYYRSNGNIDLRANAEFDINQTTENEWLAEYLLKYKKTFGEHNLDLLAGVSAQKEFNRFTTTEGIGFLNNDIRSMAAASIIQKATGGSNIRTLASTFGRLNYNYFSKYYLTASIRRDGVGNVFARENIFGIFPSAAVSWNISQEEFMSNSSFNLLKFRASWGESGNFQGISPFEFASLFSTGDALNDSNYSFDGTTTQSQGLAPLFLPNSELQWETQTQTNFGLEGELLSGSLYFTLDYYNRESGDFLFNASVPSQTGFTTRAVNGGSVVNKGFEFLVGYRKSSGDFTFDVNANLTTVDNEITDLRGNDEVVFPNEFLDSFNTNSFWFDITRSRVGGEVGAFYGFVSDGIFQNQAEIDALNTASPDGVYQDANTAPGDRRFKDISGPDGVPDGVITADDRTEIGSPIPDFYGSLNINLNYKNFDFGVNFYGQYGNEVLNLVKRELESASGYGNTASFSNVSTEYFNNRWTGEGSTNTYTRAIIDDNNVQNNRASDYFIEDGSFLRLRNVVLGYTLPTSITNKLGIDSLRIYTSAQNLFTITNYSGLDPEIGQNSDIDGNNSVTTRGIDAGAYPLSSNITFGLNLNF